MSTTVSVDGDNKDDVHRATGDDGIQWMTPWRRRQWQLDHDGHDGATHTVRNAVVLPPLLTT